MSRTHPQQEWELRLVKFPRQKRDDNRLVQRLQHQPPPVLVLVQKTQHGASEGIISGSPMVAECGTTTVGSQLYIHAPSE